MDIKEALVTEMKDNISCAIAYGSSLSEDFYEHSDFDILIFLKDCSLEELYKIKSLKEIFKSKKINVDFNVHSVSESPKKRLECFWHNNRSLYFQKEITLYGMVLIGENPFLHNKFDEKELKIESVRVINSLLYQSRKLIINRDLNNFERINLMKWCVYSVLYALSFKGIITKTKTEALEVFLDHYDLGIDPLVFLRAKQENNVTEDLVKKAYSFLNDLDKTLFEEYKNGRV